MHRRVHGARVVIYVAGTFGGRRPLAGTGGQSREYGDAGNEKGKVERFHFEESDTGSSWSAGGLPASANREPTSRLPVRKEISASKVLCSARDLANSISSANSMR